MSNLTELLFPFLPESASSRLATNSPLHLFAIVSWGATATWWLSRVLNSHPDIFCVHALNNTWNRYKKRKIPTFSNNPLRYYWKGFVKRIQSSNPSLEYLRNIFLQSTGYSLGGDIHGIPLRDVQNLKLILKDYFNAVVIVREPIARLKSQLSLYRSFGDVRAYDATQGEAIILNKKIVLPEKSYQNKLFVQGVNLLNSIKKETEFGKIFRAEDLTINESSLDSLIKEISNNTLEVHIEWLSQVLKTKRINKHKVKEFEFKDWEIEVIKSLVDKKSWELYSKLGYQKPNFI